MGYYQKERTNVLVALTSGIQSILTSIGLSELLKQIAEKKEQAEQHTRIMNNKKHDRESIKINRDIKAYQVYRVILWLFTLLESCWLALIFSGAFNDSNIMVMIGAVVISFSLIQSTKIFTLYVRDRPWHQIPLWIKIGAPLFIIGVVVSLGLLRYTSVMISSDETITTYRYLNHPVMFMIITMIPLVGTALVVYRYFLSEEELNKLRERNQLDDECKEEEQKMLTCTNEVKEMTAQRNDIAQARVKCKHAEQVLIQRFDGYVKEALGVFKLENIKHRNDSAYPVCFTKPSPKLPPVEAMESFESTQEKQLS
jgi:hypothetical protein